MTLVPSRGPGQVSLLAIFMVSLVCPTPRGLWEDLALETSGGGGSMTQPCRLSPEESEEIALASFLFLKCPSSFP